MISACFIFVSYYHCEIETYHDLGAAIKDFSQQTDDVYLNIYKKQC